MASLSSIQTWDDEADVVIAGYGVAGCATAIGALEADPSADILIVEKMPEALSGGNGRVSGQALLVPKDRDALIRYQAAMSYSNPIPDEMLEVWADEMMKLEPYILERCAEAGTKYIRGSGWGGDGDAVYEFAEYGAADAIAYNAIIAPIPSGVWITFKTCVEKRPEIRRIFDAPVMDLVQDPDSLEVFGVIIMEDGVRKAIRARKAVVLAMGGYENNDNMQRDYYGFQEVHPLGSPANTGDGIRILQKAGAALWHMRNFGQSGGVWPAIKVPDYPTAFLRRQLWQAFSWFEIAANGQRFYNEAGDHFLTHYKQNQHGHWVDTPHAQALPVHMILDQRTMDADSIITQSMTWATVVEGYKWSDDNQAEVARGWIVKADSIRELADKIGRDPDELEATFNRFQTACKAGHDPDFERPAYSLQALEPPYYAVEVAAGIVCTSGGGKRDAASRVLDHDGTPIPRLFEAGELGSMISNLYQNGSYLTEAIISGRAAGRGATQLDAWHRGDN